MYLLSKFDFVFSKYCFVGSGKELQSTVRIHTDQFSSGSTLLNSRKCNFRHANLNSGTDGKFKHGHTGPGGTFNCPGPRKWWHFKTPKVHVRTYNLFLFKNNIKIENMISKNDVGCFLNSCKYLGVSKVKTDGFRGHGYFPVSSNAE